VRERQASEQRLLRYIEDCLYKAKWGMEDHLALLKEQKLPIPPLNPDPQVLIQNEEKQPDQK
jgi:hypothetical protein